MSILPKTSHNISLIFKESSLSRLDTELLIAFLLKKTREFILTYPETEIPTTLYKKFKTLEAKRLKNWPISYLTGQKEFYGLNFTVSSAVLTPRPETEMIVDKIIELIKTAENEKHPPYIIDIGTGSGAIIISVAQELKRLFPALFKNTKFAAVDISSSALNIAKINTKKYKLSNKIKLYHGNLLTPLKLKSKEINNYQLIIAANLPYLTPKQIKESPSISHEPPLALNGGPDGLKYYRELLKQLVDLKLTNVPIRLLGETNPGQAVKIKILIKKYWPLAWLIIKKDLAGKNRLFILALNQ